MHIQIRIRLIRKQIRQTTIAFQKLKFHLDMLPFEQIVIKFGSKDLKNVSSQPSPSGTKCHRIDSSHELMIRCVYVRICVMLKYIIIIILWMGIRCITVIPFRLPLWLHYNYSKWLNYNFVRCVRVCDSLAHNRSVEKWRRRIQVRAAAETERAKR